MNGKLVPHELRHEAAMRLAAPDDPRPAADLVSLITHQPCLKGYQLMADITMTTPSALPDAIDRKRPFKLCAAMHEAPMLEDGQPERSTFRSAVANRAYVTRERGEDIFGPFDFTHKAGDLLPGTRRGPDGCNAPAIAGMALWRRADEAAAADRPELAAAFHAIGWLPAELEEPAWKNLVHRFIDEQLVRNGMVTDWAIHRLRHGDGSWAIMPHAHLIITSRGWRAERSPGRRNLAWFGSERSIQAAADAWTQLLRELTP